MVPKSLIITSVSIHLISLFNTCFMPLDLSTVSVTSAMVDLHDISCEWVSLSVFSADHRNSDCLFTHRPTTLVPAGCTVAPYMTCRGLTVSVGKEGFPCCLYGCVSIAIAQISQFTLKQQDSFL